MDKLKEKEASQENNPVIANGSFNHLNNSIIGKENKPNFDDVYKNTEPLKSLNQHKYAELKELDIKVHPELRIGNWKKVLIYPTYTISNNASTQEIEINQVSGQRIEEDGSKKSFPKISGSFYPVGCKSEELNKYNKIYLCEGLATGDKVYTALDKKVPVLCYFSKGFLSKCLKNIKSVYPDIEIVIACDLDAVEDIKKVARQYDHIYIATPNFTEEEKEKFKQEFPDKKISDFWDLWKVGGVERVKEELGKAYKPEDPEPIEFSK